MGNSSIKLGKLFGIDVGVSPIFILLFVFLVTHFSSFMADAAGVSGFLAAMGGLITVTLLYVSILAHEYGHALTARMFGIGTKGIVLHLFGGVAQVEEEPRSPKEEFWITVNGPAVNFVIASILAPILIVLNITGAAPLLFWILLPVLMANIVWAIFNLLPGFPMDGGRIVRASIWWMTGNYLKSTRIATIGGYGVGGLIVVWGIYGFLTAPGVFPIIHILAGFYIGRLAAKSMKSARYIDAFRGKTVEQLMQPVDAIVYAEWTVADVLDEYRFNQPREIYPVIDNGEFVGQLYWNDIAGLPQRQYAWTSVREILRPVDPTKTLAPEVEILTAMRKLHSLKVGSMAVFQDRRLLGYVRFEDLARYSNQKLREAGMV